MELSGSQGLLTVLIVTCLANAAFSADVDFFQIQSEFGDSISCDYLTQGIYAVWWDSKNDLTQEAYILLDSMMAYGDICLNNLEMQNPPNPQNGFYFNVYLHEPGDVFPDGWACGVGTDSYGYPYMTLPIGILGDWVTISHETFHVYQYNSDAPGFEGVDVFWYIEASANWFAAITHPGHPNAFVEAMTLVKVPHVAMWLGYDNFPSYYPDNWQRYCHQYAMALFLYYLTEIEGVPYSLICGGFYNNGPSPQDLNPQEYLFQAEWTVDLRTQFMNWAARMTNGYDFILPSQLEMAELHWNTYGDPEDDNEFTQVFNYSSYGWYSPPDSLATSAWSFNTYKILNTGLGGYNFILQGSDTGSMGDPSHFRGKVLVKNAYEESRIYDLQMQTETQGSLVLEVLPADTALYFIVGSLPEAFSGSEQLFPYMISVEPTLSSTDPPGGESARLALDHSCPNPFNTRTAIGFTIPFQGQVTLDVFDLAGRPVTTLLNEQMQSGSHEVFWNGKNYSGDFLPAGLYTIRLYHAGTCVTDRLTLLR